MSTTSQYYRTASTHSHYQTYPSSGHDQLYATPWQPDANHAPYDGPPPASFLHYSQGGADSVSHATSPPPQGWPTGHARHNSSVGWPQSLQPQNVVPRPLNHYASVEGDAAVLHQNHHQPSRPYQHVSTQPVPATYKGTNRFNEAGTSTDFPAASNGPPFTTHAQGTHTLPQPSHPRPRHPSLHIGDGLQQPLQPSSELAWNAGSEPSRHQQYPVHTSNALDSGLGHTTTSGPGWHVEHVGNALTATFQLDQTPNRQWSTTQTQPEQQSCQQQQQQHAPMPFDQSMEALDDQSGTRRPSTKKKAVRVPSSFVERQEKLKVSKRKGPLQERQRQKTHTMRKTKRICVRCRFYKSGCDEGDPCEKCDKITGHARSFREPCYREHLEDTSLVRRCNGREHQEEAEFLGYDWVHNSQLFEMEILWNLPGYGPIPNAQPMRVTFRPYSPRRGSLDVASSVWTNKEGEVKAVEQPAYAIYDTANLVSAFERYFSSLQPAIEAWIFARIQQDEIASLTYGEVLRMRGTNGSKVLDLAMRLQCLSVVSQGYGSVWSNNIPGIREYDYRRLGSSDYEAYDRQRHDRPLPGAITHQMDVAAVKYLRKLEKLFVKELATLIFKPKIKPWYELFLAFYVIFWNLEYIHHGANDYMKSKYGTMIENQVNGVVTTQIKKWEFAFPVLLYHWRCTLRGYSPFKLARENPDELRERGHIDPEGFQYVVKVADIFARVDTDRFQPPLTGFASTHYSLSSEWITQLFQVAGA